MSPVERAARALCKLDGLPTDMVGNGKPAWTQFVPQARAVLESIRDPSEAMVQAVPADRNTPIYPEDIWQAMIDAALAE